MKTTEMQFHDAKKNLSNRFGSSSDEMPIARFEADVLTVDEFFRAYRKRLLSPEHELLIAVLEQAVSDFQKYCAAGDSRGKKRCADAEAWFLDRDGDWTFSFENICSGLGLDPDYLRSGLARWKEVRMAKRNFAPMVRPGKRRGVWLVAAA